MTLRDEDVGFNWQGHIRLMTYGMAGSAMKQEVDDAFRGAIDQSDAPPAADFLRAIQMALASDLDLSEAIGLNFHQDASIREYLKAVEAVLLERLT